MLLPEVYKLRETIKHLLDQRVLVTEVKGITGYVRRFGFNKAQRALETKTLSIEIEFKKLQDQANYAKNVEPLVYVGSLLLGLFCLVLSACWVILELGTIVASFDDENEYAKFDFMNGFINWIKPSEGGSRPFFVFMIVDIMFIISTQYLV